MHQEAKNMTGKLVIAFGNWTILMPFKCYLLGIISYILGILSSIVSIINLYNNDVQFYEALSMSSWNSVSLWKK